MTNRKQTVEGQGVDIDKSACDGDTSCWNTPTPIERRISVARFDFKVRERRIGAGGLIRSSNWS